MMNLKDLDDVEKFQKHFVTPLVDAVRAEVSPLVEEVKGLRKRTAKLESNQRKALTGLAGIASLLTVAFGLGVDWIRRRIGL